MAMEKHTKKELHALENDTDLPPNVDDLVLKTRYNLSLQEQRIILFLLSKIKKEDSPLTQYVFNIQAFGEACEIDVTGGKEYKELKESLKNLSDKGFWGVVDDKGTQSLLRWINTVRISQRNSNILVKLNEDMIPFLVQLKEKYIDYKLHHVLAMKSIYGIRLYEIIKARHNTDTTVCEKKERTARKGIEEIKAENASVIEFDLAQLKQLTETENYVQINDFRRRVLEPAIKDINKYSDLLVSYDLIKKGRKFIAIRFLVHCKNTVHESL